MQINKPMRKQTPPYLNMSHSARSAQRDAATSGQRCRDMSGGPISQSIRSRTRAGPRPQSPCNAWASKRCSGDATSMESREVEAAAAPAAAAAAAAMLARAPLARVSASAMASGAPARESLYPATCRVIAALIARTASGELATEAAAPESPPTTIAYSTRDAASVHETRRKVTIESE